MQNIDGDQVAGVVSACIAGVPNFTLGMRLLVQALNLEGNNPGDAMGEGRDDMDHSGSKDAAKETKGSYCNGSVAKLGLRST